MMKVCLLVLALTAACGGAADYGPVDTRGGKTDADRKPPSDKTTEQQAEDNAQHCYVEPSEHRCDYLTALPQVLAEPMYCYAPQAQPWSAYCESTALDTGADVGSQWCCWSFLSAK
jgi:hypothetical protein